MNSYSPEKQILITGFPRSGNTYLARLMGEVLNSPVTGWKNAKPLAEEGLDRDGDYVVRQLHLKPMYENDSPDFLISPYEANIPAWNGEKIIHIIRDPRDVAVSVYHYWERKSIDEALRVMIQGGHPVAVHGPWLDFVSEWKAVEDVPVYHVNYQWLVNTPHLVITLLLISMDIESPSEERIINAIQNQSFANKRKDIKGSGDKYNYGETIQLKAMRKGVVGDWKNHFDPTQESVANAAWGDFMEEHSEIFMA